MKRYLVKYIVSRTYESVIEAQNVDEAIELHSLIPNHQMLEGGWEDNIESIEEFTDADMEEYGINDYFRKSKDGYENIYLS